MQRWLWTSAQETTKATPFSLMFGCSAQLPIDLELNLPTATYSTKSSCMSNFSKHMTQFVSKLLWNKTSTRSFMMNMHVVPHTVLDDSVTNTYLVITLYSIWERNWISQCSVPCKQDAIQKIILLHLINFPVVPRSTCSTITFTFKCLYISARGPYACTTQPLVCLFTSPDFYNCERAEYKPLLEHLSVKQIGSVSSQKWAEQVLCSQECSWLHSSRVHK